MSIVCLTTCNSVIEATYIKNNLENEGIESFLANEISATLLPGYNGIMNGGVHVMIDSSDVERAQKLVSLPNESTELVCPACSSNNIKISFSSNKFMRIFLIVFSLFTTTPFGNIKNKYSCKDCKAEF